MKPPPETSPSKPALDQSYLLKPAGKGLIAISPIPVRTLPPSHPAVPALPPVSTYVLDVWLSNHPNVASAIAWQPEGAALISWGSWTEAMKADLRKAFQDACDWYDGGRTNFQGVPYQDPPQNLLVQQFGGFLRTVISKDVAWWLFLAQIAHSLAGEIKGWFPYSIQGCSAEALDILFNGTQCFLPGNHVAGDPYNFGVPGGYMVVLAEYTPSHPTYVYRFLETNNLLGTTDVDTIARVLEWCGRNLQHSGAYAPYAHYDWSYNGACPVREIIEGSVCSNPQGTHEFAHWTAGCGATASFLRAVLRPANIAVSRIGFPAGHLAPHFVAQDCYLSHGDDPYSGHVAPGALIAIDKATYVDWFGSGDQKAIGNVGRRAVELCVDYPAVGMAGQYVEDLAQGKDHASGKVYAGFQRPPNTYYADSHFFTVQELEARGLWPRLDALAAQNGLLGPRIQIVCGIGIGGNSILVSGGTASIGPFPAAQDAHTGCNIQNVGTADLTVGAMSFSALHNVSGLGWSMYPPSPILPSTYGGGTIYFRPVASGPFSFIVTVPSSDPKQSSFAFTVSGTAV